MIRYSEYGNDASAHFIFFFLVSEILKNKKFNINDFLYWLIIAVFIALNKTTMLLSFLLLIPFVFKIKIKEILKNRKFYFCITFFVLWMIKSLIVSGCLIYPIKSLCFKNLSWTNEDKSLMQDDNIDYVIQINGKKRAILNESRGIDQDSLLNIIKSNKLSDKYLKNKVIKKIIFVENRLINLLVNE